MNANAQHHTEIDNTIDRALTALRDAQPRSGLEGRILASHERRTIAPQPLRPHFSIHLALWTVTSAAILAIASLIVLHHPGAPSSTRIARQDGFGMTAPHVPPASHRGAKSNAVILSGASQSDAESKDPEAARRATNPTPISTTNLAQTTQTLSSRPERAARSGETPVFSNCSNHHNPGCTAHDDSVLMNEISQTPTDAQVLADLHAPSHPAPPLQLTTQEKLLLHMLRYGNATQLAELNPIVRAQHDADETAAFKAFFPDPPPLQQPNGDTE